MATETMEAAALALSNLNKRVKPCWIINNNQPNDAIPCAGPADIGRRVFRLGSHMQPMESGWSAIGVVTNFIPLQEVRVSRSGFGIDGEIGEDMAVLHKSSEKDKWEILYGNGDIVSMDVGGIIAGLMLYQRVKSTAEQRLLHHLTDKMLKLNETPPHMKKAIVKSTAMGSLETNPTKRVGRVSSSQHASHTNGSSSSSSSSSSSFPGALHGQSNVGEQDDMEDAPIAYTCMVCNGADDKDTIVVCNWCNAGCHLECAQPKLHRVPYTDWFCHQCVARANSQQSIHSTSTSVKQFPTVCTHCSKEFVSAAGYHYHITNVCGVQGMPGGVVAAGVSGGGHNGSAYPSTQRNKRKYGAMGGYHDDKTIMQQGQRQGSSQAGDLSGRGKTTGLVVGRAIRSAFLAAASKHRHSHHPRTTHDNGDHDGDDNDDSFYNDDENYHEEMAEYLRCKHQWLSTPSALFAAQYIVPHQHASAELTRMLLEGHLLTTTDTRNASTPAVSLAQWVLATQGSGLGKAQGPGLGPGHTSSREKTRPSSATISSAAISMDPYHLIDLPVTALSVNVTYHQSISHQAFSSHRSLVQPLEQTFLVQPYESKQADAPGLDVYLNVAGPIWDLAFAPDYPHLLTCLQPVNSHGTGDDDGGRGGSEGSKSGGGGNNSGSVQEIEKYLVVATSRIGFPSRPKDGSAVNTIGGTYSVGDDMPYTMDTSYHFPNLLQIWCISSVPLVSAPASTSNGVHNGGEGKETEGFDHSIVINAPSSSSSSSSFDRSSMGSVGITSRYVSKATLLYCIGMHRGPHWKVSWSSWCPCPSLEESRSLLGLLAVVCGDGSCVVLLLPRELHTSGSVTTSTSSSIASTMVPVLTEESVSKWILRVGSNHHSIVSVSWSPHDPMEVCCGLNDGTVLLQKLDLTVSAKDIVLDVATTSTTPFTTSSTTTAIFTTAGAPSIASSMDTTGAVTTTTNPSKNKRGHGKSSSTATSTSDASTAVKEGSGGGSRGVLITAPYKHLKSSYSVSTSHDHQNEHDNNNDGGTLEVPCNHSMKAVAVRSSQYCPFHPQLVVAGGYSAGITLWNINNPFHPARIISQPTVNHEDEDDSLALMGFSCTSSPGWVYDVKWDPLGNGIYGGFSDESCVLWDENGWMDATARMTTNYTTSRGPTSVTSYGRMRGGNGNGMIDMSSIHSSRQHCTLYTHPRKHAGVWNVHPYVTDGQSALISVCADGTVQMCFPSLLTMGKQLLHINVDQQGEYMSMGQPMKQRRKGRQKVWQAFRIGNIVLPTTIGTNTADVPVSNKSGGSCSKSGSSNSSGNNDVVEPLIAKIEVISGLSSSSMTSSSSTITESMAVSATLFSPAVAIHAVDTTPLYFGKTNRANGNHLKDARRQLVAYGGAAGLLRIHVVDLKKEMFR